MLLCHQKLLFDCQILILTPAESEVQWTAPRVVVLGLPHIHRGQNLTIPLLAKRSWKDLLLQYRVIEVIVTLPSISELIICLYRLSHYFNLYGIS